MAILDHSDIILQDAREHLARTELITQHLKDLVTPVSGELEISMLQYDFTESVFLMKILQARGLLGRDIPSGLSDPYAIISIIPAWRGQKSQRSRIINGKIAIENCKLKSELAVTGGYATVARTRPIFSWTISPL